jgi:hypothetical protein
MSILINCCDRRLVATPCYAFGRIANSSGVIRCVILGVQKERFTTRPVFISSIGSESDRSFPERSTEHDMDEPFGALDFLTRLKMRADLVRIWQSEKKTILFVTHDVEEAIQLADRVLVMSNRPATISATGSDKVERAGTSNGGDFPDSQAHAHDAEDAVAFLRIAARIEIAGGAEAWFPDISVAVVIAG